MTRVIRDHEELRAWRRGAGETGFVPTMGALHAGHEALLRRARAENEAVVLSVFVNPAQFNDPKDLENYPATWESDLSLAEKSGVDVLWAPTKEILYPDGYRYRVSEGDFSRGLCGAHRPGHFDGVLTVVMKLLQVSSPTRAYFGEKDYQQLMLIRGMAAAFFLPVEIISVPTVREADGLALSSRNVRLTAGEREKAPLIHRVMREARTAEDARARLVGAGFQVDYVEDHDGRRYVAATLGSTRLIDNGEIAP
ncbi:MAG: pantoate--beta-alanine ligase [Bdellovibrionales bacterium]|nr:pantoate--beta-alanine ligase [Bdellovibrionales bacterium]